MPQQRIHFVQTSQRRASSISDDISDLASPQLRDESYTSQCQSSRPRSASTASRAKPSWVFSRMPEEGRETKYYNQRSGKEEWRCKHCSGTYTCSSGTAAPAKHLTDPPPEGHGLPKGAPWIANVADMQTILEQASLTAEVNPRKRRRLNNDQSGDSIAPDQVEAMYVRFITTCSLRFRLVECPGFERSWPISTPTSVIGYWIHMKPSRNG